MTNVFFIILIPIIALVISFVSTKGTLSNLKYKKQWWKIITTRGWVVVGLTLLIVGLLFWQNRISDNESKKKDKELIEQRENSDKIITNRVDSNRKVLFMELSVALKKQMLKLDTVNDAVINLKDSATGLFSSNEEPTLYILKNGVNLIKDNNGWTTTFDIIALGSTLTNFNIHVNLIFIINNEKSYTDATTLNRNYVLIQNTTHSTTVSQYFNPLPDNIFIRIKGTFTKRNSKKIYHEDRIFRYMKHNQMVYELLDYFDSKTVNNMKKSFPNNRNIIQGEKEAWTKIFELESRKAVKK